MGDLFSVSDLEKYKSLSIVITTPEQKEAAQVQLIALRKAANKLKQDIQAAKAPYLTEIKKIDEAAKPWKALLEDKDIEFERALLAYNKKIQEQIAKQNRQALTRHEKKVEKAMVNAEATGTPMPLILPPSLAATPTKTETVDGTKVTTVKRKKWRLAAEPTRDLNALPPYAHEPLGVPAEYFKLDLAKVQSVFRHIAIPGIEIYNEESLSVGKDDHEAYVK